MTPGESADTNPTIPQDKHASLPTGELVLFAVQHLHADGIPATVEEIVSACFKLFPHRFSLKNYFYWPDSALVVQALTDAKEKKLIKESPADGFILRPAGRKVARQSAKAMGVPFPKPPEAEKKTVDGGPQTADGGPQTVKAKKSKPAPVKKKVIKKKEAPTAVKKKADTKQAKPEKKSRVTGAGALPPKAKPKAKKVVRKTKTVVKAVFPAKKPVFKPAPRKKTPARKNEETSVRAAGKKVLAVTQLPLPAPAVPKKEAKKSVVRKNIQPQVKREAKAVFEKTPAASKEEAAKAGKVIKMVERSDAYRQYKNLGRKAKISEFDFRDMLFATMESSADTLRRNVDLFKRYAGIHSRADLIAFLDFAERSFAPLLRPQAKQRARKR